MNQTWLLSNSVVVIGSERVCTMRTDGELKLKEKLICDGAVGVGGPPILAAHLTEFARPVRQEHRLSRVQKRCVGGAVGPVVPEPGEPAPCELIVSRQVIPHAALEAVGLITPAPDHLASADKRSVDCTPQW